MHRMSDVTFNSIAPMFVVRDVEAAATWYRDVLGFDVGEFFREDHGPHDGDEDHPQEGEAVFVIVHRGEVEIMLQRAGPRPVISRRLEDGLGSDAYIRISGMDEFYERVVTAGATIEEELSLTFYNLREFVVRDSEGYALVFSSTPV